MTSTRTNASPRVLATSYVIFVDISIYFSIEADVRVSLPKANVKRLLTFTYTAKMVGLTTPTGYVQPDTTVTTRTKFTSDLVNAPEPSNAAPEWLAVVRPVKKLYQALYDHEAMAKNREQTFSTKANRKNKGAASKIYLAAYLANTILSVYFMWDYVGRTLGMLYMLDPSPGNYNRGQQGEIFRECQGRTVFAKALIEDTSGKLDMMCPDDEDQDIEFGEAITNAAANT